MEKQQIYFYKQVFIEGEEENLPKEPGFYIMGFENGTVMGMNYSNRDAYDTLNHVIWYYLPLDKNVMRNLVDVVWSHVKESNEVPSTKVADELINKTIWNA